MSQVEGRSPVAADEIDVGLFADVPDPLIEAPPLPSPPQIPAEASPNRGAVRLRRWLAVFLSLAWFATLLVTLGFSTRLDPMHPSLYAVVPAVFGAIALTIALRSGSSGLGSKSRMFQVATVALPILVVLLVLLGPRIEHDGFARAAFVCGDIVIVLGVVPLALATYALRRFCVTGAVWRSALIGLGIGLVTASVNALHCPNDDAMHVAVGHLWPVPIFVLVATFVLRRFAAVR